MASELLDDERLDDRALDVAQVDEQLAQPPALQLGALDLERLGEGLGGQVAGGDQPDAEQRPAAGDGDGVDLAVPEEDLGLLAGLVAHDQAAGRPGLGEVHEHGLDGGRHDCVTTTVSDPPPRDRLPAGSTDRASADRRRPATVR